VRIALVTRRYPPLIGGAEKILSYLARAFADEGAEVTVLTSQTPGRRAEVESAGGLRIVRLATNGIRGLGTWTYMRNIERWFRRNPIDLAYVSMLKHDAYATLGASYVHGFPVVLRPEGAGATGDLAWQRWGRFGTAIGRRCKSADAVVAISPAIRAELLAAGYSASIIHDLPNGVPVPPQAWKPSRSLRAVFVGRLAPEKGLDVLLDAWPTVIAAIPGASLTLIGEGPERAALENQVARLELSSSVKMPGIAADVESTLRAHDLFVLPSREEGMSIALLEAMALGMPIVASEIPGNRGLIRDRIDGVLFEPENPEALANAIVDQWDNPASGLAMGCEARRRVLEDFSIAAVARRHLDLFARLTAK
jgi:glycosyltransferase involved in cell wall biosynthesis